MNEDMTGSGSGSGSALPFAVLLIAGLCTAFATFVSAMSIFLHLKNYRKPMLQRMVIRIMLMVPIYAVSSLISLFSLEAAFVIDALRDIYEAFVIYCFFNLLLGYLGGERSLLILMHGREPKRAVFPANIFTGEIDVSDPYTYLFLKRGIIQYAQIKPVLAIATLILKATGKYNDGDLKANSGYLYISIVYNLSICLALYCLAVFWMCVNEDLASFRPMPKFLCVKGILFFSFWQSFGISILVAAGFVKNLGPYTDSEHISLALTDTLICFEMPFFAIAHMYAFSHTDYIDRRMMYAARMPVFYAIRDAFGLKDVSEDFKATLRGEGMDYREFEPSEGFMHRGLGRERRIKAGLRYSKGGQKKYWLPMPVNSAEPPENVGAVGRAIRRFAGPEPEPGEGEVYAPLLEGETSDIVHIAPDLAYKKRSVRDADSELAHKGFELPFDDPEDDDDENYTQSRSLVFGDYLYPCIDASSEIAKRIMWEEEERILRNERGAYFSPIRGNHATLPNYGAVTTASGSKGWPPTAESRADRLVDKDDNLLADTASDGVRLGWTKHDKQPTPNPSPRPPFILKHTSSTTSSASSNSSGSERRGRKTSTGERRVKARVRPDAVDLVVENEPVAEEEMNFERMKGEPAVRGSGWRKAFTVVDASEQEPPVRSPDAFMDPSVPISDEREVSRTRLEESPDAVPIAVASTPPPHARLSTGGLHHEENPWA